jgi:PilZ domain
MGTETVLSMSRDHGAPERRQHLRRPRPCGIAYLTIEGDDAGQWRDAHVVDVSPGGVGVLCDRRFEAGALLKLRFGEAGAETSLLSLVRVAHVQLRPGGEWHLGCQFATAMGDEEFGEVLKRTRPGGAAR